MTEESKLAFISGKTARIIRSLHELYGISLQEVADIYYRSETSELIDEGVADLHCRSEKYLAALIFDEWQENNRGNNPPS